MLCTQIHGAEIKLINVDVSGAADRYTDRGIYIVHVLDQSSCTMKKSDPRF